MPILQTANRYHDISAGHRVVGHEGKCVGLHGHNYRIHFECAVPELDLVGRVIDFSVIKTKLCMWLEDTWDHNMVLWDQDPLLVLWDRAMRKGEGLAIYEIDAMNQVQKSIVEVPFNPTAENMAKYLLEVIGPQQLIGTGVTLMKVTIDETRKCSATAFKTEL